MDQEENATVTFNCQNHDVSVSRSNFDVLNGNTLVLTMTLRTTGGSCTASFPQGNQSFDFPNGGPPGFKVTRNSDTEVVLTETNNNSKNQAEQYCFKAVVTSGGQTFKSVDPTITNQGVGGG